MMCFSSAALSCGQVGGQTLCHVCTLRYKLNRHKSAGGVRVFQLLLSVPLSYSFVLF